LGRAEARPRKGRRVVGFIVGGFLRECRWSGHGVFISCIQPCIPHLCKVSNPYRQEIDRR
jgi:hypothetical protein